MNFDFKSNEASKDFVKEIQAKLSEYNVNIENANDFAILLEEKESCRRCKALGACVNTNPGYATVYEDDAFVLRPCKYKKEFDLQNKKDSLIKTLYLPKKVLDADLQAFNPDSDSRRRIYKYISEFITTMDNKEECKGLYLAGSFAKGKTFTLACIANELAKRNIGCLLIYFPDLVVDLKSAIGTPRFDELLNTLKSVDVLMLDDLGSEKMTEWVRDEILGPVINYRLMEGKPLFVSSNLKPTEYVETLILSRDSIDKLKSERILNRLTSLVIYVDMNDGQTYRR